MKPVIRVVGAEEIEISMPAPKKVPNNKHMLKAWQLSYLALTNESVVLMFANECGAHLEEAKIEGYLCRLTLRFVNPNALRYYMGITKCL